MSFEYRLYNAMDCRLRDDLACVGWLRKLKPGAKISVWSFYRMRFEVCEFIQLREEGTLVWVEHKNAFQPSKDMPYPAEESPYRVKRAWRASVPRIFWWLEHMIVGAGPE